MKIVFLTSSYYPYFSAVGKCIYNIVHELEKDYEVIVISDMTIKDLSEQEVYEKHNIIRIRTNAMKNRDKLTDNLNNSIGLAKIAYKTMILLQRIGGVFNILKSKYSINKDLVAEYLEKISKIEDIDVIIPTCYPFESIIAAQIHKKRINYQTKIIPFLFDKFSDSPTLHRNNINKSIKLKNNLELEEKMISEAKSIFYVDSWKKHMIQYFPIYSDKFIQIEHPLIIDYKSSINSILPVEKNTNINITYTGVIDRIVRPPFKTLYILSKVVEIENNAIINFYILGNCVDVVDKYHDKLPQNIYNHGHVKSEIALSKVFQSDILLSIGNSDVSLIPSKIFEYMSIGKPIIHFYISEDDSVIEMLKTYGLALCIQQTKYPNEEYIEEIISFLRNAKGKSKRFEDVKKDFYEATPQFISEKLIKNILDK